MPKPHRELVDLEAAEAARQRSARRPHRTGRCTPCSRARRPASPCPRPEPARRCPSMRAGGGPRSRRQARRPRRTPAGPSPSSAQGRPGPPMGSFAGRRPAVNPEGRGTTRASPRRLRLHRPSPSSRSQGGTQPHRQPRQPCRCRPACPWTLPRQAPSRRVHPQAASRGGRQGPSRHRSARRPNRTRGGWPPSRARPAPSRRPSQARRCPSCARRRCTWGRPPWCRSR
mmetsp:Transcript_68344/g.212353  ORF Transcript_68344/g.212353 Transcript_68344/m.212353 type:complete len:228 (+) Transcript_68344:655-1338(+)